MKRYGARPSVCLSHSPAAAACSGFAALGLAGRRYRSVAAANVGSATLSAYVGGSSCSFSIR